MIFVDISERKVKILKAIIDEYIATGIPIGSRTLSKRPGFDYSPATIRNEMADLEEMGYLEKSHVSSGRMPSDLAYRFYVDRLMHVPDITSEDLKFIKSYFTGKVDALEQVMDMTAKVLSDATHHISMVTRPKLNEIKLKRIQIIKITEGKALVVIVTDNGIVKDSLINIPKDMTDSNFEMLSNMLTEAAHNLSMSDALNRIKEIVTDTAVNQRLFGEHVFRALESQASQNEVVLGGVGNFLDFPQFSEKGKARDFLTTLETKEKLYNILENTADMEFTIRIGKENAYDEFKDMSIVTATYSVGGEKVGSYGIIGPTRMDYARVVSVLNFVGRSLNEIITGYLSDDDHK